MKKSLITLTVMLAAAALVAVFCGSATAKVTGSCADCHTMHNSQDGTNMIHNTSIDGTGGPDGGGYTSLTRGTCVGCHTGTVNAGPIPFVNSASEPTTTLAGGNFYWVAQSGGSAKGHNVKGIPGMTEDAVLTTAPGGEDTGTCSDNTCHQSLFEPDGLDTGCQGCHLAPEHHATQQADGAPALAANGFFRFLSGHSSGHGVEGIEDDDWQYTKGPADHNEYLGKIDDPTDKGGFWSIGENTMTAYCTGCHGNFHIQRDGSTTSANWIRHPSDAVLPNSGEYMAYTVYDPDVPVARPSLDSYTGPSATVEPGTDLVMCLSCHRAHGSPNDDLLRWDYSGMVAGSGTSDTGCFKCHTLKNASSPVL